MLRTFSGRQPHPAAAAEAPQPGSDPSADAAVAPPLPERTGTPSQDAVAAPDAAARVGSPAGEEPPPAGSVAAGEAAWEAQLAALEAAKAACADVVARIEAIESTIQVMQNPPPPRHDLLNMYSGEIGICVLLFYFVALYQHSL